jgi:GntR family transcriptional regulator
MLLNLTDLSDEPLQSQIATQIRAKILKGDLAPGETLPSIRVLAREQRVSVVTVQRGYESLEQDGLIYSRRGKGFFVSQLRERTRKKMAAQRLIEKIEPMLKGALEEGMSPGEIKAAIDSVLDRNKKKEQKGE